MLNLGFAEIEIRYRSHKWSQIAKSSIVWWIECGKAWIKGCEYWCKAGHKKTLRQFYPYYFHGHDQCRKDIICKCGLEMTTKEPEKRIFGRDPGVIHEYYDVGLGQIVKGRAHRAKLIRDKGLYEIGTDKTWKEDLAKSRRLEEYKRDKEEKENLLTDLHRILK